MKRIGLCLWLLAAMAGCASVEEKRNFCFLQISDIHLFPQHAGAKEAQNAPSAQTLAWVCREARRPQRFDNSSPGTPRPSFLLVTGDLTEYSAIGDTFASFERCLSHLPIPRYIVPGNHDNTWTSFMPIMRRVHGSDNYAFDSHGCHFVGLNSSSIHEPRPVVDARMLEFLRKDLARVPKDTPVFLFQHHPLAGGEYATPLEQLQFLETIRGHNVVLLLMGHGHGVRAERWNQLDSVMGGSTFGPNAGYNIIEVKDGMVRVAYRYKDPAKGIKRLIEKPLAPAAVREVELAVAQAGNEAVEVTAFMRGATPSRMTASIDARDAKPGEMAATGGKFTARLSTAGLPPGMHFVHVKAQTDAGSYDRAVEFLHAPANSAVRASQAKLPAGMKAGPVALDDGCIVATTAGQVVRIRRGAPPAELLSTGTEIIHAPALADGTLYFSAAEKGVYSMAIDGRVNWARAVGAAVHGTPAVVGDSLYVGDSEGRVHAMDRRTGELEWSKQHATFSIEMPLTAHEGVLYFGAWDGYVYAVNAADGSLRWKERGPSAQTGKKDLQSRYYAPADSPVVVAGGRLFVTDRGYWLGSYSLDGRYLGTIGEGVAAIGKAEDGQGIHARTLAKGLTRYDAEGKPAWTAEVPLGRYATPPTAAGGKVYACSDQGLLSVLDAGTGKVLWQYQATHRLRTIGLVGVDAAGNAYVAGMDGSLTKANARSAQ